MRAGTRLLDVLDRFERRGLLLARAADVFVMGDPCIVRDEEAGAWRMFLFALPPGHGQALCHGDPTRPDAWRFGGPLVFTNPDVLGDRGAFKPFVILDSARPGYAACINRRYALLVVSNPRSKEVRRAWSPSLAGPWTLEPGVLIEPGAGCDFDAKHVDAVSAYYFLGRNEVIYFYMGYPEIAQAHPLSPYGSSQGAAVETTGIETGAEISNNDAARSTTSVRKLGAILRPATARGHWAGGWVGGLQLLRGRGHRWIAVVNASPTAPDPKDESISREEPPPSLGGFAYCDEERPVSGWRWCDAPIESVDAIPVAARESGERVNLWRHFALPLEDGRIALFYNSGDYFAEQIYLKVSA